MGFHDLGRYSQADTLAAGVAVARFRHPIERFEYTLQFARRHARTLIADDDRQPRGLPMCDGYFDRRALGTIAHRVAQHVLDGAR